MLTNSGENSLIEKANVYLKEFLAVHDDIAFDRPKDGIMREFLTKKEWEFFDKHGRFPNYGEIPNQNWDKTKFIEKARFREYATKKYAWSVPCTKAVLAIAKLSPIISIGAGSGYWEMLLSKAGAEVEAFDLLWDGTHKFKKLYFPVLYGNETRILTYPRHTLFLSWPPYNSPMAYKALCLTKAEHVVYIGEGRGGCTGDDNFHELLEDQFDEIEKIDIPQYQHIRDSLMLYRRKA